MASLKANPGTLLYIDARHAGWVAASDMASRLDSAGIAQADGFSLNVSGFDSTTSEIAYGKQVSALAGGKHFVIDTGRNGLGPDPSASGATRPAEHSASDPPR